MEMVKMAFFNSNRILSILSFLLLFVITTNGSNHNIENDEVKLKVEIFEGIIGQKWDDAIFMFLLSSVENIQNKVVRNEELDGIAFKTINNHREYFNTLIGKKIDNIFTKNEQKLLGNLIKEPIFIKIRNASKNGRNDLNQKEKEEIARYSKELDFKKIMITLIEGKNINEMMIDKIGMEFMGRFLGKIE